MAYPLDLPHLSVFKQLYHLPYPAKPEGLIVPDWLFNLTLSAWSPLAVAIIYIVGTHATNKRFKAGKPKPADLVKVSWSLSQAVLGHNILLAVYSGWTFVNVASRLFTYFSNGVSASGFQGLVNAYCTVPIHDASREGLGLFVWLFYISKYYEVVDSIILILKGKPVSHLQSYHHAGAMACMWAAYRYSASAAFIFLLFNSAVHTAMYLYYSMTAMKLPFTGALKRSMTTIQITQLVVGIQLAAANLFVRYNPFAYPHGALPSPGQSIPNSASSNLVGSLGISINGTNVVGTNGLVSSVSKEAITTIQNAISSTLSASQTASCVSTSGQAFAVVLNVAYLLPLIYLFVSFYINSYKKRTKKGSKIN